jgi:hypothetical protein
MRDFVDVHKRTGSHAHLARTAHRRLYCGVSRRSASIRG